MNEKKREENQTLRLKSDLNEFISKSLSQIKIKITLCFYLILFI